MTPTEPSILNIPVDYGGIWHLAWALGPALFLFYAVMQRSKPFLDPVGLAFVYFVGRALWLLEAPFLPFGDYTRAFQATAGQGLVEFLLAILIACFVTANFSEEKFAKAISALVLFECTAVWAFHGGLMGWESFDTALVALCMPFIRSKLVIGVALVTIGFHHGTTALTILFAELLAVYPWVALSTIPLLVFIAGMHHRGGALLDGQERIQTWIQLLTVWFHQGPSAWVFGTGSGSFMWISAMSARFKGTYFLCMHNDWLQILFEQGLIGLLFVISVFLRAILGAMGRERILGAVFGTGAFALTYHPLRFFPSAVLIAIIFWRALENRNGQEDFAS